MWSFRYAKIERMANKLRENIFKRKERKFTRYSNSMDNWIISHLTHSQKMDTKDGQQNYTKLSRANTRKN